MKLWEPCRCLKVVAMPGCWTWLHTAFDQWKAQPFKDACGKTSRMACHAPASKSAVTISTDEFPSLFCTARKTSVLSSFRRRDIRAKSRGNCIDLPSFSTKAWMDISWPVGFRKDCTILMVPSMYHFFACRRILSWYSVAKIRRPPRQHGGQLSEILRTGESPCWSRNPSLWGSLGLNAVLWLFTYRLMFEVFGATNLSCTVSETVASTMSRAGRKTWSTAIALACAETFLRCGSLRSAGCTWTLAPWTKELPRCRTVARHLIVADRTTRPHCSLLVLALYPISKSSPVVHCRSLPPYAYGKYQSQRTPLLQGAETVNLAPRKSRSQIPTQSDYGSQSVGRILYRRWI